MMLARLTLLLPLAVAFTVTAPRAAPPCGVPRRGASILGAAKKGFGAKVKAKRPPSRDSVKAKPSTRDGRGGGGGAPVVQLDDDRTVAYVWHLSKGWRPEWGGALYWAGADHAVATHPASFNTLVLFCVTTTSAHFVTTVSPHHEGKRLTFNGWWQSAWLPSEADAELDAVLADEARGDKVTHAQLQAIADVLADPWQNIDAARRERLDGQREALMRRLFPRARWRELRARRRPADVARRRRGCARRATARAPVIVFVVKIFRFSEMDQEIARLQAEVARLREAACRPYLRDVLAFCETVASERLDGFLVRDLAITDDHARHADMRRMTYADKVSIVPELTKRGYHVTQFPEDHSGGAPMMIDFDAPAPAAVEGLVLHRPDAPRFEVGAARRGARRAGRGCSASSCATGGGRAAPRR
ncbi:hypothetical protein JL721_8887 [Aureococcus anophagefferens]|nr:hypothetical protein JL721_8887 [Aureococcus anophagefferens]